MLKDKSGSMKNFKGINRKNINLLDFKKYLTVNKNLYRTFQINYTSDHNLKLYLIQNILILKL
jgi:hypothetical protein